MPMNWNDAAIAKLFGAILATGDVKVDADKVAEYMGCSTRALRDQLNRLRRNSDIDIGSTPKPKVPTKRKNASDVKRGSHLLATDDSEIEATPSKVRKTPKKASPIEMMDEIKEEEEVEESGGEVI